MKPRTVADHFATLARVLAIAAQAVLAIRVIQLRLGRRYPILLLACLFGAISATSLMPFPISSRSYWEPWWKVQVGVVLFHMLIAFEVVAKSSESSPKLGKTTLTVLAGLLMLAGVATLWSREIDGIPFNTILNQVLLVKRHVDGAIGLWVMLFAWFYWSAADVGERENVVQYRRWIGAFFLAEASSYAMALSGPKAALTVYSVVALLVTAGCFTFLAISLSAAGETYTPIRTKFSRMSDDDLDNTFSGRPHRR